MTINEHMETWEIVRHLDNQSPQLLLPHQAAGAILTQEDQQAQKQALADVALARTILASRGKRLVQTTFGWNAVDEKEEEEHGINTGIDRKATSRRHKSSHNGYPCR